MKQVESDRRLLPGGQILVVDDDDRISQLIDRYLTRLGHDVETAATVPEAIGRIDEANFDLVITDLQMPGPSGIDLLVEARTRRPGTRLIMMSGCADVPSAAAAIDQGVDALIMKPFDLDELRSRVEDSLQRHSRERDTAHEREVLEARVRQRDMESRTLVLRAAHSLAAAVEVKDAYTAGHAVRVSSYGLTLAEHFGSIDLDRFRLGGDLHDVGKIGIPDQVLNKPGRLTPDEMHLIRQHPLAGERILRPLIDDPMVIGIVRWHHERWDGAGYPDGLSGTSIPLAARILAVADTLDAMTSQRAYRDGLPWQVAVEEIFRCAGTQFDPSVVEAFDAVVSSLEKNYRRFRQSESEEDVSPKAAAVA